jgi:hypothetical protein
MVSEIEAMYLHIKERPLQEATQLLRRTKVRLNVGLAIMENARRHLAMGDEISIALARDYLDEAMKYMEKDSFTATEEYTSIVYNGGLCKECNGIGVKNR